MRKLFILLSVIAFASGCKKAEDKKGGWDSRLERPYCNDPIAVNYNWDFPGTPDNSTCVYPADIFEGSYQYTDSIYDNNDNLVATAVVPITITAYSKTSIQLKGFCPSGSIDLTATRRLWADIDTIVGNGQLACRNTDTISGSISASSISNSPVSFQFTALTDTGTFYHRGSAVK